MGFGDRLFSDAETAENPIEYLFVVDLAADLADLVQGGSELQTNQLQGRGFGCLGCLEGLVEGFLGVCEALALARLAWWPDFMPSTADIVPTR